MLTSQIYSSFLRPLLFKLDPESAHHLTLSLASSARSGVIYKLLSAKLPEQRPRKLMGLTFPNALGVAAGLDKDGRAIDIFAALGFGHIEVGTVTPRAQPGNPRPRIFRFPKDRTLINRMGFPSEGLEVARRNIEAARARIGQRMIIGGNIGKCKDTSLEDAIEDYKVCFLGLAPLVDMIVINVSSPNTPGLRQLQDRDKLDAIIKTLQDLNEWGRPILVKVSPDLSEEQLNDLVDCCMSNGISGVVATNTTLSRTGLSVETSETGGMSGALLTNRSREVVKTIRDKVTAEKLCIIGCGGISGADDAKAMLDAGADLLQVYTGLIYSGPSLVPEIIRVTG